MNDLEICDFMQIKIFHKDIWSNFFVQKLEKIEKW